MPKDKKWSTRELQKEFTIIVLVAPYVRVERKSDGKRGTMQFNRYPRFYHSFIED